MEQVLHALLADFRLFATQCKPSGVLSMLFGRKGRQGNYTHRQRFVSERRTVGVHARPAPAQAKDLARAGESGLTS
jgi:hypothetical protein